MAGYDPVTRTWRIMRGEFYLETLDVLQRLYEAAQKCGTHVHPDDPCARALGGFFPRWRSSCRMRSCSANSRWFSSTRDGRFALAFFPFFFAFLRASRRPSFSSRTPDEPAYLCTAPAPD